MRFPADLKYIDPYVAKLKNNENIIEINDLGAGSRKNKSNKRRVKEIYKSSSSSPKKADLIRRICEYENSEFTCLELGTNLGVSTFAISSSPKCKKIITVEGCANLFEFSKNNLESQPKIEIIHSSFEDQLVFLLENDTPNIVYIDGNHTYEATKRYFETIVKHSCVELIIFDDINWSDGMLNAWNEILLNDQFKVSINLFRIGLLYKRTGQTKEDFTIRY